MPATLRNLRILTGMPVSLRGRLNLLVLATLAPILIFAVLMIVRLSDQERLTFQRGAIERSRALSTAIDSQLRSSIALLESLATSPSLTDGDLSVFQERSARILTSQPQWSTINLALPSGKMVASALLPLNSELPITPRDPRSFDEVLRTGRPVVGQLVLTRARAEYEFPVRVPVMRDGAVKYVLSALVKPRSISELLAAQKLPSDWIGVVVDGSGRFVARTIEPQRSVGQSASESLRATLGGSAEGWFRGTTVESWDVYTAFNRSAFSGWTVALAMPADFVHATLRHALLYLILFGSGLLALSLLIAWILSGQTAASINSLTMMAQEVGSGKNPATPVVPSRIAEVETVREAFVAAHRLLEEQSEEKDRIAVRLQLALNSGNIGVHEWHPQTNELIWDDRMRAHWGLSPGIPITYDIFLRGIHPDDRPKMQAALDHALNPGGFGQYNAEYRVIGIEDHIERWIESRSQAVFENGKAVRLSGTTIDITQRKAFQAELERQVQERTAQLQETIGELEAFSYSVSHDMRAPLRAMEGYAKALLTDYRDRLDPEALHWLDRICRSAHRLDSLIKDVLSYSRVSKEEIQLSPVDLDGLVEDILATSSEFQSVQARIVVEKPLGRVLGHEAYLTQCITNLLSNAIKFNRDGIAPVVLIRSEQFDGKVRLWFEDNGIGIDPAHHERIFQIFGQVYPEERYGGTGIGLAIVRKAVQRMNGAAGVDSALNQGSRFWLVLNGEKHDA